MLKVFVCSQFGGLSSNLELAKRYSKYVFDNGGAPYAPHVMYPSILEESIPSERDLGIDAGIEFLRVCDEMWVFVVGGILSDGMVKEIVSAKLNNTSIRWFDATSIDSVTEILHIPLDKIPTKGDLVQAKNVDGLSVVSSFDTIMKGLSAGHSYEEYNTMIDDMLGTGLSDRDVEAEEAYELQNRTRPNER